MWKSIGKPLCFVAMALFLGLAIYRIFSINRSVHQTLADERASLPDKSKIPFEKKIHPSHSSDDVQIIQNTREARALVEFRDSYFAATSGGLVQISHEGKMLRHFTVADGLPESDLQCLAVYDDRLFIGTRTTGLVIFDGEKFESYTWPDRKSQAVTTLLPDGGELLIGTFNGGLLRFDGSDFAEIKADKERILAVNCLLKDGTRLYVGTFNNGLRIYENDTWSHFTTADGLPSNRVVGAAVKDGILYAATDFGLAVLEGDAFRSVAVIPSLSGMSLRGDRLLLVKDDGELFTFDSALKKVSGKGGMQNSRLVSTGENLWLLSDQGISGIDDARLRPFGPQQNSQLSDNFVSALAFDAEANLWVGTFRRGIDVLSPTGERIRHFETDNLREVNFLQTDGVMVRAATTSGIVSFGKDFSITDSLTKKEGLPSNSIAHFSGGTIATAKGLVFRDEGKLRVLSTVQGLPGNSVYATLQFGDRLYAGTLGGLAEIENRRVVRTFKDSNSGLTTNWVTAICLAGERLFIGTYGGGVFELLPSGDVRSFQPETGKFAVNVNAMFSDGERLYIGTLDGARILNLRTQEWRTLKSPLPSEMVLSIAAHGSAIYFGTPSGIAKIDKSYFANGERK